MEPIIKSEIEAFLARQTVDNIEIERLKAELVKAYSEVTYQRTLITELAEALKDANAFVSKRTTTMDEELWTRAREATTR